MFKHLLGQIVEAGLTREYIANELGISPSSLSNKLTGKTEFRISECCKIKNILNYENSLDELFQKLN